MDKNKIYKEALQNWGEKSQLKMLQEECLELALEIRKIERNDKFTNILELKSEIADVKIMIEQMEIVFDIEDDYEYKLERLRNKLEEEKE